MATKNKKSANPSDQGLTQEQLDADNTARDAAPIEDARKEQKAGTSTEERVEVGSRHVSKAAVDPKEVTQVGAGVGLTPGTAVTLTMGKRDVTGTVTAVHPGNRANADAGVPEIEPTVDVKAFTGNPDTGGFELLTGIPVNNVRQNANFR